MFMATPTTTPTVETLNPNVHQTREDVADVLVRCLGTKEATGKTFEVQSLPGFEKVSDGHTAQNRRICNVNANRALVALDSLELVCVLFSATPDDRFSPVCFLVIVGKYFSMPGCCACTLQSRF